MSTYKFPKHTGYIFQETELPVDQETDKEGNARLPQPIKVDYDPRNSVSEGNEAC